MADVICENYYCGHWKNRRCTLQDIQLDRVGNCIIFEHIPIDEELLEKNRAAYAAEYKRDELADREADRLLILEREKK